VNLVLRLVIGTLAVLITSYLLPGVEVDGFLTAVIVAVVLGIVNSALKPILVLLTLPITLLTLGLFTFVISAFLVLLVDWLIPGFVVVNFWWALLFALVLSLVNAFLNTLSKPTHN
jgi:putative membrane protein